MLRERVGKIIGQIETKSLEQKLLTPPRLRIKFEDKTIAEAIESVNVAAKSKFTLAKTSGVDPRKKISLDTGELPYWEAIEAFLNAAEITEHFRKPDATIQKDLRFSSIDGPGGIEIVHIIGPLPADNDSFPSFPQLQSGKSNQPSQLKSSIRIKAAPFDHPRNNANPMSGEVRFQLLANAAVGLTINEIVGVDIRNAVAEDGRSLEIVRNTTSTNNVPLTEFYVGHGKARRRIFSEDGAMIYATSSQRLFPVTLRSEGLKIRKLSELTGLLNARIVAPSDRLFTIDRVKDADGKKIDLGDGFRVTFTETKTRLTSTAVVRLTMEIDQISQHLRYNFPYKARNSTVSIQRHYGKESGIVPPPDFYLVLPSGEMSRATSVTASNPEAMEDGGRYDLEIFFDKPETWEGVSLIAKGHRLVTVNMPFTLKGVEMPDK